MSDTLHIRLFSREKEVLDEMKARGYPVAEVVRELIRNYGKDEFPREKGYSVAARLRAEVAVKKLETQAEIDAMTNEEYATKVLRGKVVGSKVEFRLANSNPVKFPLTTIKQHTVENNELIRIHNQLLDRTFTYLGDQEPSEEQYKEIWKGW